ncbi:hypothetical protein GCM10023170_007460 [Phytohabitans houttuyneae]|uniref:Uncharacterized protein n=2 Tax=Phytohabitans houttuyneae TaxID=1076126 RepID=A0A6V8K1W6_9ACTN|nr:hypothetical protein Phou_033020 [Phytohabitans houttuyneae]
MSAAGTLFALVPGESTPGRAAVMAIPTAAMFAISALGTFVALAWAVHGFVDNDLDVQRAAAGIAHAVWIVGATLVYLTIVNAEHHLCSPLLGAHYRSATWLPLLVGVIVATALAGATLLLAGKYGPTRPVRQYWPCVAGLITMFILYGIAWLTPADAWAVVASRDGILVKDGVPPRRLHLITIGSVLYVGALGCLLLGALPPAMTRRQRAVAVGGRTTSVAAPPVRPGLGDPHGDVPTSPTANR